MSERNERRFERVCVALEAASSGETALDIAANLAQELEAELAGFFIEDENVLRAAALPFTRDVGFVSGASRPMRLEDVRRALRAQAQALKSSIAATAEELRLRWSFTIVAGAGVAPLLDVATRLNVTVFAPRRTFLGARTLAHRSAGACSGSIGVVYDGSEEALAAVRVAARFARSREAPLVLLLSTGEERQADGLQRYVHAIVASEVPAVSCIRVEGLSAGSMAGAARFASTTLLVVPLAVTSRGELRELLGRVSCPLVMIGGERQGADQKELSQRK